MTGFHWTRLLAVVMLVLAPASWPYGYYNLLRLLVCVVASYGAWLAAERDSWGWVWVLGALGLLFNPIVPVYLSRDTWAVVDLAAAGVLSVTFIDGPFRPRRRQEVRQSGKEQRAGAERARAVPPPKSESALPPELAERLRNWQERMNRRAGRPNPPTVVPVPLAPREVNVGRPAWRTSRSSSTLPLFFLYGAIRAAGWPQRHSWLLLNRRVLPGGLIRVVYKDLLKRAMALGAFHPGVAVQLIVDSYREKNWCQEAEEFLSALDTTFGVRAPGRGVRIPLSDVFRRMPDLTMWDALLEFDVETPLVFPEGLVPFGRLREDGIVRGLHWNFAAALMFGLEHSRQVRAALENECQQARDALPRWRAAGLGIPPDYESPTVDQVVADSVGLVTAYTHERGSLAPVPFEVLAHPKLVTRF